MEHSRNICIIYSSVLLVCVDQKKATSFKSGHLSQGLFPTLARKVPSTLPQMNCIGLLRSSIASSLIHDLVTQTCPQHESYQAGYPVSPLVSPQEFSTHLLPTGFPDCKFSCVHEGLSCVPALVPVLNHDSVEQRLLHCVSTTQTTSMHGLSSA